MSKFSMNDIIDGLQTVRDRATSCGCLSNMEENSLDAALYLLGNITNLQMALYDKGSLELAAEEVAMHLCFDEKTGTLIRTSHSKCTGCMFSPTLDEGADGVDCPDKFRPWLCKKITEET